jgi:hypothetical protein
VTYASEVLADSPWLYWRLDDVTGSTTAADASGNGRNGTYHGTYTLGRAGLLLGDANKAATFSTTGTDGGCTVACSDDPSAWSVECWVAGTNGSGTLIGRQSASFGQSILRMNLNGAGIVQAIIWKNSSTSASVQADGYPVNDGLPHHLAMTYDGTTLRLYVDGVERGTPSTAVSGALVTSNTPFHVASISGTDAGCDYRVDEAAYYHTALSAARIEAHYEAGTPTTTYADVVRWDEPLLYWPLGDASGSSTVTDASGNGRHGTVVNGATLGVTGLLTDDSDTAIEFDGVNDYVTWTGSAMLTNSATVSVECWFTNASLPSFLGYLFQVGGASSSNVNAAIGSDGLIDVQVDPTGTGSGIATPTTSYSDGNPHHLVVTYDDANNAVLLYIDGVRVVATSVSGTSKLINVDNVFLGALNAIGSGHLDCVVDEFAIYSQVLNPNRVLKHYLAGTADTTSWSAQVLADSPLIYWRLDEASGVHVDWSGNGRDTATPSGIAYQQSGLLSSTSAVAPTATTTAGASRADEFALDATSPTLELVAKTAPTGAIQWFGGKTGASAAMQSLALRMSSADVLQVGFRVSTDLNLLYYDYTGDVAFADGNWHHFVVTWDAGTDTLSLYLDGVLAQTWSVPGSTMFVGTGPVFYGSREVGGDMVDAIDEFVYYGTALSEVRIAAHAAALGYELPGTGLPVTVWNGSTELPATLTIWNGTTEVSAWVSELAP